MKAADVLTDLLWPSRCIVCRRYMGPEPPGICRRCLSEMPPPPRGGLYAPCKISGNMAYISGCGCVVDGCEANGKLGKEYTVEQGQAFARNCILNVLAVLQREIEREYPDFRICGGICNDQGEKLSVLLSAEMARARQHICAQIRRQFPQKRIAHLLRQNEHIVRLQK